jgi:hypothetical protein
MKTDISKRSDFTLLLVAVGPDGFNSNPELQEIEDAATAEEIWGGVV